MTAIGLGFAVKTPPVPDSEVSVLNRHPLPTVILILNAGSVSAWSITDAFGATQAVDAPLTSGQNILLSPGEAIAIKYAGEAPSWKWRAMH